LGNHITGLTGERHMEEHDIQYFSEFLAEFQKESDRGGALVGAALLDARLERLLLSHLVKGKGSEELVSGGNAPLGSFSARINVCLALGLITPPEQHELNLVRKIRNEFAHREHGITFDDQKISGICRALRPRRSQDDSDGYTPRQRFNDAVMFNALQLWYRPEHAAEYKCQERTWPY
jgi:mannitol operon repressor